MVRSYNETGLTDSNQIELIVIKPPWPFTLSSNADSPDTDGQFELNWTISIDANNYSIYMYNSEITEINASVTLIASGITDLNYSMSLESGTYYILIRSYNEVGLIDSNQIMITVEIPVGEPFNFISFLTNPLTIISFGIIIGVLAVVIIKFRKRSYKSTEKEIKRIEEIRRQK